MDLDLFFIIIAVLYYAADFISNVKKRKKSPNIPEQQIPEPIIFDMPPTKIEPFSQLVVVKENSINAPEIILDESVKSPSEEKQSSWCNKIHPSLVVNGIIFAEILQPPRAQRPLETRFKRRR